MSDSKDTAEYDQSKDNRSWLEICDEELVDIKDETSSPTQPALKCESPLSVNSEINELLNYSDSEIKDEPECESNIANSTIEEGEIRSDLDDSVVKKETQNDDGFASSAAISNILSYAKVLSRGTKSEIAPVRKAVSNIPTEDLSLTSHLDIFHVDSPCKEIKKEETEIDIMLDEDTVMFSPVKKEDNPAKNMKRSFQLIDSPVQIKRERTNSVRSTHKVSKSDVCTDVHSSRTSSTSSKNSSPSSKREREVNPDILARRQKQIDYGKNTAGYQRYVQLIPKHKRSKQFDHPRTPPKNLKMSRRTWDGLVKHWRLRLHKFDPSNETDDFDLDSVNFDQYSLSSEMSSSYDSSSVKSDSTPSTPSQPNPTKEDNDDWTTDRKEKTEKPKELWPECPRKSDKSDDDDYLGCESLNENCVKACS